METGENLTVNLDRTQSFRRILIFVTIYEGARSFADLHATVTLQPQHGAPVEFSLDECTVPSTVCALALITNSGGDLIVQREARYLVPERGSARSARSTAPTGGHELDPRQKMTRPVAPRPARSPLLERRVRACVGAALPGAPRPR